MKKDPAQQYYESYDSNEFFEDELDEDFQVFIT
jgi:hypothetical protein